MLKRCVILAIASAGFARIPVSGQSIAPVAVVNHFDLSRSIASRLEPEPPRVGAAPFVLLGALVGGAAVTAYWVHKAKVTAQQNGNDSWGIIPPIVFVTVGLGALSGGVLGDAIYNAVGRP